MGRLPHPGFPQPGVGVGLGGGADVPPLDVGDDKEVLFPGIGDGALHHLQAPPAQPFVVGGLGLYGGHHVAQSVDESLIKRPHGLGRPLEGLAVRLIAGFEDMGRDLPRLGVQPRHGGIFLRPDLLL